MNGPSKNKRFKVDENGTKRAVEVGIIGMGDMGRLYALKLIGAGWHVNVCDRPENYEKLREEFIGNPSVDSNCELYRFPSLRMIY